MKHLLLLLVSLSITYIASAQNGNLKDDTDSVPRTVKQLDEVIVTSEKTPIKKPVSFGKAGLAPLDNPQSTGIVSNTVIKDQQAMRLGDVLKNVSGVSLTQQRLGVAETFS